MIEEEKVQATVESDSEQFKRDLEEIIQKVQDNAEKTVKANDKVQKSSEETQKGIVGLFKKIIGGYQELSFKMFVWNQMFGGIKKVADKISDLAIRTDTLNLSFKGLVATAEAFGQDGAIAEKNALRIVEMTKGMVSLEQATQGYKFLMQTFKDNEVAMQVAENALEVGAFGNVVGDLGQAFVDFGKGAKTGSIELMENIGLTQRLSSIMKRANIDISNGIDIINDRAQQQAFLNYVMEEGETFAGNLAEATDSYTASIKQNDLIIDRFLVNLGKKLQPMVKMFSDLTAKGAEFLNLFVEESDDRSDNILELTKQMQTLKQEIGSLGRNTLEAKVKQEELQKVMNDLSRISPDVVKSYDEQGNAVFSLKDAFTSLKLEKIDELQIDKQAREEKLKGYKEEQESLNKVLASKKQEYETGKFTLEEDLKNAQAIERQRQEFVKKNLTDIERMKKTQEISDEQTSKMLDEEIKKLEQLNKNTLENSGKEIAAAKEQLEIYDASFNARNRQLISENKLLDQQINSQERAIDNIDLTIQKIQEAQNLGGFETAIGITTTEKTVTEDEVVTPEGGKESKVDIEGRTRRFFNERKVAYEKASKEYNDAKIALEDKLIDKYEFDMIEAEHNAEKSIYEEAQKTREEMLKAKTIEDLDELKTSFKIEQNKIKSTQKLAELAIENKKDIDKKTKQEKEKTNREILKLDEQAYQERVRATEKLGEAEVRYIEDQSKAKNEFDLKIAENEIKLQREIHAKTLELNEEIRNAESLAEKQALKEKYDETLNNFVAEKSLATAILNQTLAEKESENKQLSELERQRIKDYKKNVTDYIATKAELEEELKVTEDEYRKKVLESRIKTNEEIFRLQKEQSELMKTTDDEAQREEIENYYNRLIKIEEAKQKAYEVTVSSEEDQAEKEQKIREKELKNLRKSVEEREEIYAKLEQIRKGEIDAKDLNLDSYNSLSEKEKVYLEEEAQRNMKSLEIAKAYKDDAISIKQAQLRAEETLGAMSNEMAAQLFNAEKLNGAMIAEAMNQALQQKLLVKGQDALAESLWHTAVGVGRVAMGDPRSAESFAAAGEYAAVAATYGVISAGLTGGKTGVSQPESYESRKEKAEAEATETQELEKTKTEYDVVNINFDEASRDMTMLVMRQAEHLVKEGYDFALVKKK